MRYTWVFSARCLFFLGMDHESAVKFAALTLLSDFFAATLSKQVFQRTGYINIAWQHLPKSFYFLFSRFLHRSWLKHATSNLNLLFRCFLLLCFGLNSIRFGVRPLWADVPLWRCIWVTTCDVYLGESWCQYQKQQFHRMFSFNSKMVWGGNILKYGHEISRKAIVKKITSEQHVFQNISSWILPNAVWLKLPRSISSFDLSCKQPWVAREMPKQPSVVYFNLFWVVFGTQFISNVFLVGKLLRTISRTILISSVLQWSSQGGSYRPLRTGEVESGSGSGHHVVSRFFWVHFWLISL